MLWRNWFYLVVVYGCGGFDGCVWMLLIGGEGDGLMLWRYVGFVWFCWILGYCFGWVVVCDEIDVLYVVDMENVM